MMRRDIWQALINEEQKAANLKAKNERKAMAPRQMRARMAKAPVPCYALVNPAPHDKVVYLGLSIHIDFRDITKKTRWAYPPACRIAWQWTSNHERLVVRAAPENLDILALVVETFVELVVDITIAEEVEPLNEV